MVLLCRIIGKGDKGFVDYRNGKNCVIYNMVIPAEDDALIWLGIIDILFVNYRCKLANRNIENLHGDDVLHLM